MAFWNRKKENRADEIHPSEATIQANLTLEALFGRSDMTRANALQIPSVSGAINKLAFAVAKLPVKLYEKDATGRPVEIKDDNRSFLLTSDPGDAMNIVDFWKAVIEDYFVGKGGYIYIDRYHDYRVRSLRYVDSNRIAFAVNNDPIFKDFDIYVEGKRYFPFDFIKILRKTKDGCHSRSIVEENSTILSVAYESLKFENKVVKKGGNKRGFFKSAKRLDKTALAELREAVEKLYTNENSERAPILNDGVDFKETSATSLELQLNENKVTNGDEIMKIFGFPSSVIKGGASESDRKLFIDCVVDLCNTIEAALDKDLLLESEKRSRYFAFDTRDLIRGNMKERFDAYAIAIDKHIMQVDEIREREDLPPLGFNFVKLGLGDVLYNPQTKDLFVPNTGTTSKLDGMKGGDEG